jgi:hypothetical protein
MKSFNVRLAQSLNCLCAAGLAFAFLFCVASSPHAYAAESSINWNWLNLSLRIAETNFGVGVSVPVTMVVSNRTGMDHTIYCNEGDPCVCGPGNVSIVEVKSGEAIGCKLSTQQRAGLQNNYFTRVEGHNSKSFSLDLTIGHDITNNGAYQVRALGWFSAIEPPSNHQFSAVTTPPLVIVISPKSH